MKCFALVITVLLGFALFSGCAAIPGLTAETATPEPVPTPMWAFEDLLNQAAGQAPFRLLIPDKSKLPFQIEHTGIDFISGSETQPFVVTQLYRTGGSELRITQSSLTGQIPAKAVAEVAVRGVIGHWVVLNTGERVLYWEENDSSLTIGGDLAEEDILILAEALVPHPGDSRVVVDGRPTNPDAARLVEALGQQGVELQLQTINPPTAWLSPAPGVSYKIGDGWLHLHWFEDEQAAMQKAEEIVTEPRWAVIDWVAAPHFFRCGTTIALYLGREAAVLTALQEACGASFAPVEGQPPGISPTGTIPLQSFHWVDATHGWATTPDRRLLRTEDGGSTWTDVTPAMGMVYDGSAFFLDERSAWVVDHSDCPGGAVCRLSRTLDGGRTWQSLSAPFAFSAYVQFLDESTGWAVERDCGAGTCMGNLYRTADRGETWARALVSNPGGPETLPEGVSFHIPSSDTFRFQSPTTIWLGGGGIVSGVSEAAATLWVSRDTGQTWQRQDLPLPESETLLGFPVTVDLPVFLTDREGFFTANYTLAGEGGADPLEVLAVYATQDGGQTWAPRPALLEGVVWMDRVDFVSVTDAFVPCAENLCATHDGAHTWEAISSTFRWVLEGDQTLVDWDFVDPTTGWVLVAQPSGEPALYKTTDGGLSWEQLHPAEVILQR